MGFRALKSLTFFVGLLLFGGAFVALLLFGSLFNPAPYQIVVALEELPAYTVLEPSMLGVDSQTMNSKVAARLVHKGQLDEYVGGMLIEPVHVGEPLRRGAVVSPDNPAARQRIALALDDPTQVAMVIPVSPDTVPDSVQAGDFVNITMSLGEAQQLSGTSPSASGATADLTPTPLPSSMEEVMQSTAQQVVLPFAKVVLKNVSVLQVQHKRVSNPNYGVGFGEGQSTQPAFIDGDLERLVVLIPADAEEMLAFAISNGSLQLALVPHVAVLDRLPGPSFGVTWEDFLAFFREERLRALRGQDTGLIPMPTVPIPTPGASTAITPTISISPTEVVPGETETSMVATATITTPHPLPSPWAQAGILTGTPSPGVPPATAPASLPPGTSLAGADIPQPGAGGVSPDSSEGEVDLSGFILPAAMCAIVMILIIGVILVLRIARGKRAGE